MSNYLYNGVELPALPEWDREKYPFAYVIFLNTLEDIEFDAYWLHVSDTIEYGVNESGNRGIKGWSIASVNRHTDTNWNVMDISDASPSYPYYQNSMWANFDVLNEDGSLYLAATDPIPVNPAPTLDPTALLMGWQVGNRIRQRTKGATE